MIWGIPKSAGVVAFRKSSHISNELSCFETEWRPMSSLPKGYVDTTYLDTVQKLVNDYKRLTYEQMHIKPGQIVLDVGCGPGTDTIPLARQVSTSGQIIGVDYDTKMIAEAEQRAQKAGVSDWVIHKCADAIELPFESDYFDACRAERLFEHLLNPAKALSEMVRVTKSGGWIVVLDSDWGTFSMDANEIETERRLVRFFSEHSVNNGYSGRQLYRLFKQQGLADISTQMCGVTFTDYPFTRQLVLMDKSEREALALGVIAVQELEQLHNFWEQANAEGDFFASVSMILVSGRKP
jgi:ubiquinone/menaquinone biosynthesis C-methylase UbiE